MEYTTSKTVTDLEFQEIYNNNSINIDTELNLKFRKENPSYIITGSIGSLTNNGDNTLTYNLSIDYEIN